ncbi:MAG: phosphoribosylformylglycinamidine synthase subunit PurQ [Deltaproteobacteria bacterium]|nr:phosphoribosylformylglycinamidine synthase subunit PurQ [Deltaproteobacteria bacterium]
MKFGIVVFPGSNCDHDCHHVITKVLGHEAKFLWHKEQDLHGVDGVILPGGFSYGDYLRSGAMAACSPIMDSIKAFAHDGGMVFGICNGFQILLEAKLLPGVLMRNQSLKFICKDVCLRVENTETPFTNTMQTGDVLTLPIAHMDGNYTLDRRSATKLLEEGRVLFRYCDSSGQVDDESNPNGSVESIAGVMNEQGNVAGMMPHPERCSESMLGNRDGLKIFESIVKAWTK